MTAVNGTPPALRDAPTLSEFPEPVVDQDAERCVLGAVFTRPDLVDQLRLIGRDAFYHHSRQAIYDAITHLADQGRALTLLSVADYIGVTCQGRKQLAQDHVRELDQCDRWRDNATDYLHWADRVTRAARSRQLLAVGIHLAHLATTEQDEDTEDRILRVAQDLMDRFDTTILRRADRFPRLDWDTAWHEDYTTIDWLPGRLLERGQQIALVGDGKAGKSLFALDWVYHAITGRGFLGDQARPPINVLYFDRENNQADIITRLQAFGARPEELERLDYRLFPRFSGSLDASNTAAMEFFGIIDEQPRGLVVIDTVSRFISGEENDSSTWLQLYARVHAELKRRVIAAVRLDHFGKDTGRGARGNSAKAQDVDHVWELAAGQPFITRGEHLEHHQTRVQLKRTHTRTGRGDDIIHVARHGTKSLETGQWLAGRTRHDPTGTGPAQPIAVDDHEPGSVEWIIAQLDAHQVDPGWGRERVAAWCAKHGIKSSKAKLEQVVKFRKQFTNEQDTLPAP